MFLRSFDFISPEITLYHKGKLRHKNYVSGVLTLLVYAIIFASIIYYFRDLYYHDNPTAYFFNKFEKNIGEYPLVSPSLFHYLTAGLTDIDFQSINIILITKYITSYVSNNNLNEIPHWIYDKCTMDDLKGIPGEIDNITAFLEGACLRKYYSVSLDKYVLPNDPNFVYPQLSEGASNPNTTIFGVIIERCRNSTMEKSNMPRCRGENEISNYILTSMQVAIRVIDHYIDVANYNQPIQSYFYTVTNGISEVTFSSNQLNFDPYLVRTHKGLLLDTIYEEKSYSFSQNAKSVFNTEDTGILCTFYFWMQNRVQIYDRSYKKLTDTLANIGGFSKIVFLVAEFLNYFFNRYTIYIDTAKSFNHLYKIENNIKRLENIAQNLSIFERKPMFKGYTNIKGKIKFKDFDNSSIKINDSNNVISNNNLTNLNNLNLNNDKSIVNTNDINVKNNNSNFIISNSNNNNLNNENQNIRIKVDHINKHCITNNKRENTKFKTKAFTTEFNKTHLPPDIQQLNSKATFCNFIYYLICEKICHKNHSKLNIEILVNLRKKILDEAFLFQLFIQSNKLNIAWTNQSKNSNKNIIIPLINFHNSS